MMRRFAAIGVALASATTLSGCIAAVAAIPLAAGGVMVRKQVSGSDEREQERAAPAPSPTPAAAGEPNSKVEPFRIVGVVNGPMPGPGGVAPVPGQPQPGKPPAGMQYLYGSGEGAAISIQAYQALWRYVSDRVADRKAGLDIRGVVLSPEGSLEVPKFVACGKKPLAVIFDVDETVMLNLGFEADDAMRGTGYDDARWRRWEQTGAEKVAPVPGAVETLEGMRRAGVTIVFNTNRSEANAAHTIAALEAAGLGSAKLGETLWLRGEGPGRSGKDGRRWEIAAKYCVIAQVGDQLGDFTDLFNPGGVPVPIRRNMASQTLISAMWGSGWFLLPNPVYGTGLHGGVDDIFPADKRWTDPGEAPAPAATPEPAPAAAPASNAAPAGKEGLN
ncbi:HAD family acid phosphatase [Sphingomonas sp. AOB5]|uniref:5'-nucleotidase, lipoprotein e(P4) family n=1 Tax=Sphingomonas sp. AOB5 TaxID=3034017 RepID=UPI0023F79DB1|nr:HAD family acid phosphatase [Sphingomonas sp. AOB5]MDF7774652.1 HAD family acid phosphatase [Sphingomonas sp. AOB5]